MDFTVNEPTIITEANRSDYLEDSIECLFKRRWKIYQSSLFGVDTKMFLQHSLDINRRLNDANSLKKKLLYKVHLKLCPLLRFSAVVSEALKVEVVLNGAKVVYTGYFCNWSNNAEEKADLPLFLVEGNARLCRSVHAALADVLFCTIQEVEFNHDNLVTLFGLLVNFAEKNVEGNAELKYNLPGLEESNAITVSFKAKEIAVIFNFYKAQLIDAIHYFFYEKVLNHILNCYSLDLSSARLVGVSLPEAIVCKQGQISFRREASAKAILVAIQCFFEDAQPSAPALSIPSGSS